MEKRRDPVRQHAAAAALIAACALGAGLLPSSPGAAACELPPGKRIEAQRLSLSYRTVPAKIAVGQQFEVFIGVCPKGNSSVAGPVRADAHMPEHRHGMNYRPSITPAAGGYRSEGWLFHMPGRWEFVFEAGGERLTDSVRIE